MPLSNASGASLPPPPHGSGSGWFATPFLYDSFIHYFTPVYPDASRPGGLSYLRANSRVTMMAVWMGAATMRSCVVESPMRAWRLLGLYLM